MALFIVSQSRLVEVGCTTGSGKDCRLEGQMISWAGVMCCDRWLLELSHVWHWIWAKGERGEAGKNEDWERETQDWSVFYNFQLSWPHHKLTYSCHHLASSVESNTFPHKMHIKWFTGTCSHLRRFIFCYFVVLHYYSSVWLHFNLIGVTL